MFTWIFFLHCLDRSVVLIAHPGTDQSSLWGWHFGLFWPGFSWGAGGSAYQTEGAWDKDGKGLSIWDVFSHKKGKILQNDTGDSSCEGYHKVRVSWRPEQPPLDRNHHFTAVFSPPQDDVSLMKQLKLNHYRFSISWPRLIPTGIKCECVTTDWRTVSRTCWWLNTLIPFPAEHVNEKGVQYYDYLINHLLENNITPIVTLYHWDLPQVNNNIWIQLVFSQ